MRTRMVVAAWVAALVLGAGAGCKNLFPHRSPGEVLWRKNCADCHGLDGAGNTVQYMGNPWADLTDDHWKTGGGDASSFESVVREGVFGEMRGFPELSHEEIQTLYQYLRVLRHEAQPAGPAP
jgi:mono/diheme cytochrome c family protein